MPFIDAADGAKLFYKDWGTGTPVILIHGWPVNADMWEFQAPFLAANGFRVIAYDRRGFGRSDQTWTGYDYDTLADDLAAILTTLNLSGAALVGFSMGGGEVARYLSRHGTGRLSRVALVSSVLPYLLHTDANPEGVPSSIFEKMKDGLATDRPNFLTGFLKKFFGAGMLNFTVSDQALHWALSLALQASPKATIDCVTAFSATDFRPDLAAFTLPTLIVHGSSDDTVPLKASAERVARALRTARFEVYDGAPHGLFLTEKDRLNADLLAFLRA